MKRIIWHWTAGAYGANGLERNHYHYIIEPERIVPGTRNPEANLNIKDGDYSAHTRALNTGSIGVAIDAMAGARQFPFDAGYHPITKRQVAMLVELSADLAETYNIPVTRKTMLSHAEVEPTLGVKQRGKWDIAWLPGMKGSGDPVQIGDALRQRVSQELSNRQVTVSRFRLPYWLRKLLKL